MKRLKLLIIYIAIGILAVLAIISFYNHENNKKDTTAVVLEMRALNRWETASFTIEKVIDTGNSGNIFQQFLFGNRILLIAHGEVIGGFDLSTLSTNNVKIHNSSIAVTLPAPQILLTTLDNSKTQVYDRQKGLLVPSSNDLESQALLTAQNQIKSAACADGILTNASENAKKQLTSILKTLGYSDITITIPQGKC